MSELQRLRDRVEELEHLLGIEQTFTGHLRVIFNLSEEQARVLGVLLSKPMATEDVLYAALYGDRPECDQPGAEATIRKHIHFLRKRLKPHSIEIANVWGHGWCLSEDHKRIVKERVPQNRLTPPSLADVPVQAKRPWS